MSGAVFSGAYTFTTIFIATLELDVCLDPLIGSNVNRALKFSALQQCTYKCKLSCNALGGGEAQFVS